MPFSTQTSHKQYRSYNWLRSRNGDFQREFRISVLYPGLPRMFGLTELQGFARSNQPKSEHWLSKPHFWATWSFILRLEFCFRSRWIEELYILYTIFHIICLQIRVSRVQEDQNGELWILTQYSWGQIPIYNDILCVIFLKESDNDDNHKQ